MNKNRSLKLLSEEDYSAVRAIIDSMQECRNREDLKALFKSHIIPFLGAHSAVYAWKDPEVPSYQLIDSVNISTQGMTLIKEFITHNPQANSILGHTHPIIERDVVLPTTDGSEEVEVFLKSADEDKNGIKYFSINHQGMITLALREPNFGAAIHCKVGDGRLWSMRDVRILEIMRPHLVLAIKSIVLSEKLAVQVSFSKVLAHSSTPMAMVSRDARISFRNQQFADLLDLQVGEKLPGDLDQLMQRAISDDDKPVRAGKLSVKNPLYKHALGEFRLSFKPLEGEGFDELELWVLRMEPATDEYENLNQLIQNAGLTGREVETCYLVREGIDDRQIAGRLFISPHTVKTHIKRIYEKLGVHSRAQLVATLNNNPNRFM
jgi:DNA-binding CsgD family transcriptional regulator